MDPGRALALLDGAARIRVLVVGDIMLDRYITGVVERISPEAPVPVVRVSGERAAPGGAGNVAANVTALGASCRLVGHVGEDAEGDALMRALTASGVAPDGVVRGTHRPTTVKTRVLAKHQQIVRFDREVEEDLGDALAREISARVRDSAATSDVLVVQDYNKGVLTPAVIDALLEAGSAHGVPCIVDPKRRNFFAYPGVTVFKPNARELADALGAFIHPDDPAWMEDVRGRLGCEHLLVTLGDQGMALQTASREHVRLPTLAQSVYDVSGAGDTVTAAVAVALGAGASLAEAAALANHAAAVEVTKAGVQTVSPAEIEAHVRAHPGW
ncbi:MAG TPA: PfkB family carbohydrate kinase [Longimicrobiales bacterium]|nr:PfkB family carbohydrate kinase [Longimicrobiales bacterium]